MARIAETMRDLRSEGGLEPQQADAVGIAVARMVEDAADRVVDKLLIRLGAWTLAVVTLATAVLIAVLD